jgi:arylsulfatase A-like enzyme
MAIVAPGVSKPGSKTEAPIDYTNIYPTLCELTGLPVPEHVKGASLMSLLKDPTAKWDGVAVCTHGKGNHAVRDAQWRYIRYADGSEELYDHAKDPYEWTNLAAEVGMSDLKTKLAAALPKEEVKPTSGAEKKKEKGEGKGKKKKKAE